MAHWTTNDGKFIDLFGKKFVLGSGTKWIGNRLIAVFTLTETKLILVYIKWQVFPYMKNMKSAQKLMSTVIEKKYVDAFTT